MLGTKRRMEARQCSRYLHYESTQFRRREQCLHSRLLIADAYLFVVWNIQVNGFFLAWRSLLWQLACQLLLQLAYQLLLQSGMSVALAAWHAGCSCSLACQSTPFPPHLPMLPLQVDNDYFLCPCAIASHDGRLNSSFPIENRLLPQVRGGRGGVGTGLEGVVTAYNEWSRSSRNIPALL